MASPIARVVQRLFVAILLLAGLAVLFGTMPLPAPVRAQGSPFSCAKDGQSKCVTATSAYPGFMCEAGDCITCVEQPGWICGYGVVLHDHRWVQ